MDLETKIGDFSPVLFYVCMTIASLALAPPLQERVFVRFGEISETEKEQIS